MDEARASRSSAVGSRITSRADVMMCLPGSGHGWWVHTGLDHLESDAVRRLVEGLVEGRTSCGSWLFAETRLRDALRSSA
jgi:hypothetical protein